MRHREPFGPVPAQPDPGQGSRSHAHHCAHELEEQDDEELGKALGVGHEDGAVAAVDRHGRPLRILGGEGSDGCLGASVAAVD